ncbi:hypothetical protein GCM10023224_04910 [Streptomonospora halophila]|uniref:Uncharacterized protein n=1 Tax=Streptomonospora halophila TaxID=427369 RepID=A0ABP9G8P7_9ACTN
MSSPITHLPPRVTYRGAGGQVYLLAWVRTPGGMRARVTWCEIYETSTDYRWQVADVPVSQVTRVDGQVYVQVPVIERARSPTTPPSSPAPGERNADPGARKSPAPTRGRGAFSLGPCDDANTAARGRTIGQAATTSDGFGFT